MGQQVMIVRRHIDPFTFVWMGLPAARVQGRGQWACLLQECREEARCKEGAGLHRGHKARWRADPSSGRASCMQVGCHSEVLQRCQLTVVPLHIINP